MNTTKSNEKESETIEIGEQSRSVNYPKMMNFWQDEYFTLVKNTLNCKMTQHYETQPKTVITAIIW